MSKFAKISLLFFVMNGVMFTSWADRGVGKKKTNITLNLASRSGKNLSFNLKTGLKYKGSLLTSTETVKTGVQLNNIVTYKKGNNIYIIPFKQKVLVPEIEKGYTGMKVILKPKL
jgi:hypothetical protein